MEQRETTNEESWIKTLLKLAKINEAESRSSQQDLQDDKEGID